VEAVAVYARPRNEHLLLKAHQDEPNGAGFMRDERKAVVHVLDFGILEPLLFRNTRTGLRIDPEVGGFDVLEVRPPPRDATSFADVSGDVQEDEHGQRESDLLHSREARIVVRFPLIGRRDQLATVDTLAVCHRCESARNRPAVLLEGRAHGPLFGRLRVNRSHRHAGRREAG
jgi:hypothetical protein